MAPTDVVLGATIDGYAVEGGFDDDDGATPATSFLAAQSLGRIRPSVRTQGTFEHLDDLVARAAQLGLAEVRLTLEWARLERRPGERDEVALGRYLDALRAAGAASLGAVVVLCDAAWPSWLGQEPWLSTWAPRRFAEHARWVAERLEGLARAVVTFRAPNAAARAGWVLGVRPPFRRRARGDAVSALDGMLVAHQHAVEAIARDPGAPGCAILFEAMPAYGDAELWRDVASGAGDVGALAARRRAWDAAVGARPPRRGGMARLRDVERLRSAAGWSSLPPFEWWLGGEDVALLSAALQRAEGAVRVVELGAGTAGWDAQLAAALPALAAAPGAPLVHLHGLVASTGPLARPAGLLEVAQHDGGWALRGPDAIVAERLGGRRR